ncbi:HAD family hydrolase [Actinoalloteichus hymeniacidonis]|uniref:Beta-phosphoglucomutase n=1 Tax=Actinoalloteichus hymeniacidonis TaxID=340345 RepID=A0AAC9MZM7_9PSEU|nr:beta-phosphoglucomutase family hydrolase [Actinoalloteichus hymeniacidonis]AOS64232.1 beta-phosphoglucomutase hydrolase [Actinoalloteichus hymeniacidonis]MBB5907700.1 beta-phosphoglucomutase family hydrolase [Actinoalloteichus hymeniacidonis]
MPSIDTTQVDAVLFDLDGVVTDTARVHAIAWRQLFDDFLLARPDVAGEDHRPFDRQDYLREVDGKSRIAGARDFLRSRGIRLDEGAEDTDERSPDDPETVRSLAARKDAYFRTALADGVRVFPDARRLLWTLRENGIRTAIVSASRNCATVLSVAGIADQFDTRVDGVLAEERGLRSKPQPDVFRVAAESLGVSPARAVVIEDAEAGVTSGRRGGFTLVVGVARAEGADAALRRAGADLVLRDLDELTVATPTPVEAAGPVRDERLA